MATRNPEFPLPFDVVLANRWLSTDLQALNLSLDQQLEIRHRLFIVCHAYYRAYLDVDVGLFLHLHDFQNLCLLFDHVCPNLCERMTRTRVFYLYSLIIGAYGHLPLPDATRTWLDNSMNLLNLQPSPALPSNDVSYQVLPF